MSELPDFWKKLQTMDGMGALALQFLCLTAARSGEVRGMKWHEVDMNKRLWTIPKGRMKAGREHRVPLPNVAVALLTTIPRLEGCDYVFFSPKGTQLSDMSVSAVMRRMDDKAQEDEGKRFLDPQSGRPAVPHGLRSSFRDWAAEIGHDHVIAELALAHRVGSVVERAYRRSDMVERRRELLKDWAGYLGC